MVYSDEVKGLTPYKGLALNVAICLNLWIKGSAIGITVTWGQRGREGGDGAGVTLDGLTMTTSSDLRLALHSAVASGHVGEWEEWQECGVQRLRRQEGVKNRGSWKGGVQV